MQAVHMRFRPKASARREPDQPAQQTSRFTHLNQVNVFSQPPIPKGESITAIPYSKGKLAGMPKINWDDKD